MCELFCVDVCVAKLLSLSETILAGASDKATPALASAQSESNDNPPQTPSSPSLRSPEGGGVWGFLAAEGGAVKKGCPSISTAFGLTVGSRAKQDWIRSWRSEETTSDIDGVASAVAIRNRSAATLRPDSSLHGGLPVAR